MDKYTQTPYGKSELQDMVLILTSLHGEAQEYIETLSKQVVAEWKAKYPEAEQFGAILAIELIASMILNGKWQPSIGKRWIYDPNSRVWYS